MEGNLVVSLNMMRRSALAAAAALLALAAHSTAAKAQASAYVPLDDVAYTYVDALMSRGELRSLSGMERPYTRGELVTA